MLWLALRFPQLPLDVFASESDQRSRPPRAEHTTPSDPAILVYQAVRGSKKVLHSNDTAEAMGVRKAMSLVTAEALLQAHLEGKPSTPTTQEPTPASGNNNATAQLYQCLERDSSREWVALQQLAAACYDFTPHVSVHNPPALEPSTGSSQRDTGLLLEVSGSLKLFNGLARLCQLLQQKIKPWQCFVQLGLGPTPEGAWLLSQSRYSPGDNYCEHDYQTQLGHIQLDKIDCFNEAFNQLNKMGLVQLHQVLAMPMAELGRRFGEDFIAYLQALTGKRNSALMRRAETCEFRSRVQLNHPITDLQQLQPVITNLLQQLLQFLRREQHQCEAIEWLLLSATGDRQSIPVVCQPIHSDWQLLQQLTMIHFDNLTINFEIDSVELTLKQHSYFNQETADLFAADPELALNQQAVLRRWQLLLTRLHNRLGERSTLQLAEQPEHWPEKLNHWHTSQVQNNPKDKISAPQTNNPPSDLAHNQTDTTPLAPRPSWLIDPPAELTQRDHQLFWRGPLKLLLGPERLQGQWWLPGNGQCRDYFIAEQNDFRRLWIYHDHKQKQWFVQGIFG